MVPKNLKRNLVNSFSIKEKYILIHKNSFVKAEKFYKILKFGLKIKIFNIKKLHFIKNFNDFEKAFKTEEGVIKFNKLNTFLIRKVESTCTVLIAQ